MKDEWSDEAVAKAMAQESRRPVEWRMTRNGLRYQRHCMALSSSLVWGAFSMAAVMYDRGRLLQSAGPLAEGRPHDEIPYDYAEGQYAVRVGLAGLCTARPRFADVAAIDGACDNCGSHHIFDERRPPRPRDLTEYEWFLWGTPLHVSNRTVAGHADTRAPPAEGEAPPPEHAVDCQGERLAARIVELFNELNVATRDAKEGGEYAVAAAMYRRLESAVGGSDAAVEKFGCLGLSAHYISHLQSIAQQPGTAPVAASESGASRHPAQQPEDSEAALAAVDALEAALDPGAWRAVPRAMPSAAAAIPRVIIQTWRSTRLPPRYAQLVQHVLKLHAGWTHLFFDDAAVEAFVAEREPTWLPLYRALNHSPIQRIDLFRYLAVYHYGGFYLDVDVLLVRPLELLAGTDIACAFPFERLVDAATHPTLVHHVGVHELLGQYFFGASARHPFIAAILRYVHRASAEPSWAMVPQPLEGDEDDDKTVHYTTGPAIVTRAFFEGGFMRHVHVIYATSHSLADPQGWGRAGPFGYHLHAGTWKRGKELSSERMLERVARHRKAGRHEAAAGLLMRAAMHDGEGLGHDGIVAVLDQYRECYDALGTPAQADLNIAREFYKQGQYDHAHMYLGQVDKATGAQTALRADAFHLRWQVRRAELAKAHAKGGEVGPREEREARLELDRAIELRPNHAPYRLDAAVRELRQPAADGQQQAVDELVAALALEQGESLHAGSGENGEAAQLSAPATRAHLLYAWTVAPHIRGKLLAEPSLAAQLQAMLGRRSSVAEAPCELETKADLPFVAADLDGPSQDPGDATLERTAQVADRSATAVKVPAGPVRVGDDAAARGTSQAELHINSFGVPELTTRDE